MSLEKYVRYHQTEINKLNKRKENDPHIKLVERWLIEGMFISKLIRNNSDYNELSKLYGYMIGKYMESIEYHRSEIRRIVNFGVDV